MSLRYRTIKRLIPAALATVSVAALTSACASSPIQGSAASNITTEAPSIYRGTELGVPVALPAVTLTDTDGNAYDLKAESAGKLTLVYFGYTHCPDVCPTTMANVAAALRLVTPAQRAKVDVVFVTTDPDEDTAAVIKSWLGKFDPSFVGLTGTVDAVDNAAKLSGVPVDPPVKNADGTYDISHGSQVTAFQADGQAHVVWLDSMSPQDIAHDIPLLESTA